MISSGSITSPSWAVAVVGDVDEWTREERKPGTIRCERSGPWQADEQRFQPKWCSSSPTLGIGSSVHDVSLRAPIDDRQEIGRLDAGPLTQAREVEEFLARLHRLLRRAEQRLGPDVIVRHSAPSPTY